MDVVSFMSILVFYIWIVLPATSGDKTLNMLFVLAAVLVAVYSVRHHWPGRQRLGLRMDNLLPATFLYMGTALPYALIVLLWHSEFLGLREPNWPDMRSALGLVFWAFLQEFCLLAFLLTRLRQIMGKEVPAVLVAAGIFAFFHLPNPFLTLYTLGGGLIVGAIYLRLPNLLAAALAHATASVLVAQLLPKAVTGWMKVGPLYWWAGS